MPALCFFVLFSGKDGSNSLFETVPRLAEHQNGLGIHFMAKRLPVAELIGLMSASSRGSTCTACWTAGRRPCTLSQTGDCARVAASSTSGRARQQTGSISPVKWLRAGDFLGKPFDILDGQVELHFTDEPDLFVRAARFGRCAQDVDFGVRRLRGWQPAVSPPQDRYPPTDWLLPNAPKYCHPARMLTTCLVAASATTWQRMSTLGGTQ